MASGVNVELRKHNKYNRILNLIRNNAGISRADIKRITGYSTNTVLRGVEHLIGAGLVTELGTGKSGGGRPPSLLSVNRNGGLFIGLEFYAEYISCVAVDLSGEQVYINRTALNRSLDAASILDALKSEISRAIKTVSPLGTVRGIGLGVPGQIDRENGVSVLYEHIESWHDVPLKEVIGKQFGLPVYLENNVRVMALVHKWLDQQHHDDFLFVCVRSGIAMATVIDGNVYQGKNGMAGEISHLPVPGGTRPCVCGRTGCLVAEVSNDAVIDRFRASGGVRPAVMRDFIDAVRAGDAMAVEILRLTADHLGFALAYAATVLNPGRIIFWGDLMRAGAPFIDELKARIDAHTAAAIHRDLAVTCSAWGEELGALGCAILVLQRQFGFLESQV